MSSNPQLLTRLKYEMDLFKKDPPPGVQVWNANGERVDSLEASIIGPDETPYEHGIFKLTITLPTRYPFEPPDIKYVTRIYHPNVDDQGRICLDTLKMPPQGSWGPAHNLSTTLTTIRLLMAHPNPDDPLMKEITEQYRNNHQLFIKTAKEFTKKYAIDSQQQQTVNKKQTNENEKNTSTSSTTSTTSTTESIDSDTPNKKRNRDDDEEEQVEKEKEETLEKGSFKHQKTNNDPEETKEEEPEEEQEEEDVWE
ncbi:hypothetical protein DFA_12046 [Cavenderia fasciculata]|uniref:E2 ubiquitin-conjugating enzyme n=1 Tax=Cavenderia fasciculata TaxID=261658 RepID=F4QFH5_CACFS|nr:uncharacterized protein DFA_12046 [Cavenderia fasciculata]EGG14276.1 hypothetical protein DFA_12046 [Cavenderia fasciculata]|eukprot:XP_004350985.1 hypothetical protein DFA_12046 [Cavenderia fasciculata]